MSTSPSNNDSASQASTILPDAETLTTSGKLNLRQWAGTSWIVLFSCQGDYEAKELLSVLVDQRLSNLAKRNIKLLGISSTSLDAHKQWVLAVNGSYSLSELNTNGTLLEIAMDSDKKICKACKFVSESKPSKATKLASSTVVLIDPSQEIKLSLLHPASLFSNFENILKVVDDNTQNTDSGDSSSPAEPEGSTNENNTGDADASGTSNENPDPEATRKMTAIFKRIISFDTATKLNAAAKPVLTSPYLQNAVQVLEQATGLGSTLPFVAPAFLVLKFIIEIEKRAREVDEKCQDLVERITFVMSHLATLKDLNVKEATKRVIERITEALKDCAALMEAYRRQRPLVRRLSLSNRERFEECALSLKRGTEDLLLSLQIHQTGHLEILTRKVPLDSQDQAAESFLANNGGSVENVQSDPDLLKAFAEQLHLTLDDQVIEDLNSNISNAIQQNHDRLEQILKNNIHDAVIDALKLWGQQQDQAEKEQKLMCVQCGNEYRTSTNGPQSCSFHKYPPEGTKKRKTYSCCTSSSPCQFQSHRAKHHCEYAYGTFFDHVYPILRYKDTRDTWAEVEDVDLEEGSRATQNAFVGQLLRLESDIGSVVEPSIVIKVGDVWPSSPYFFDTFTPSELETISEEISKTGKTLIFRTSEDDAEFCMAEWMFSNGTITGVRLTGQARSSSAPSIRECPIDIKTCQKSGEVLKVSEGGLRSFKPDRAYEIPQTVWHHPEINVKATRETRTDFKCRADADFPVILMIKSNPPLQANVDTFRYDVDTFEGEISIFNNSTASDSGSPKAITIASIMGMFRYIGDNEYQPLQPLVLRNENVPFTLGSNEGRSFRFSALVPRLPSESVPNLHIAWANCAFGARHRPLRLKIIAQDVSGRQCSIVAEYVFQPWHADTEEPNDVGFFYINNAEHRQRNTVHVRKDAGLGDGVFYVGGSFVTVDGLKRATYLAQKTGNTEIDLGVLRTHAAYGTGWEWSWTVYALVDLSCCRVYAIKVLLTGGESSQKLQSACLGYVAVPEYGDVIDEVRPIQYAVESVKLPELEPLDIPNYPQDDAFDDDVDNTIKGPVDVEPAEEPTTANAAALPVADATTSTKSEKIMHDGALLASIDSNLSDLRSDVSGIHTMLERIATALEKLLDTQARSGGG